MNPTRLSHAIIAASDASSARALAATCGISPSTLSKLVSTSRRIDVDTLHALCTKTAPRVGLAILLEHLRDEVDRAGRAQTDVAIAATGESADDDLAVLAAELMHERTRGASELRSMLHDLANLVRRYRLSIDVYGERSDESHLRTQMAAEKKPSATSKSPADAQEARFLRAEAKAKRQVESEAPSVGKGAKSPRP